MDNTKSTTSTRPLHAPTPVHTPAHPTTRALNALLPFGLYPAHTATTHHHQPISTQLLAQITASPLTLITGPSGSGKSTLLRALKHALPNTLSPSDLPSPTLTTPIVNLFPTTLDHALSCLSAAGLAQPNLWSLPAQALSTGEHARLTLARLLSIATPRHTLLLDELATPLDRLTARALSASINRLSKRTRTPRIIAAAAHEDLPTFLDTDLLIHAPDHSILPNQYTKEPITIEPGTIDDYHALKHHHYIASDPASIARIDRAMRRCPVTNTPILAGILVVAYPTLNAHWRDRAWPGRYTTNNKSINATRINTELRTLARIIVAPHSRTMGIATALVRHYLDHPLTPATEAIAAMGSTNPFLAQSGMTEYPIPHSPTDLRLLDALTHLRLTPHRLLDQSAPLHPLLTRELTTWARARKLNPTDPNLPAHAAFRLLTQPRAYAHVHVHVQAHTQHHTEHRA